MPEMHRFRGLLFSIGDVQSAEINFEWTTAHSFDMPSRLKDMM